MKKLLQIFRRKTVAQPVTPPVTVEKPQKSLAEVEKCVLKKIADLLETNDGWELEKTSAGLTTRYILSHKKGCRLGKLPSLPDRVVIYNPDISVTGLQEAWMVARINRIEQHLLEVAAKKEEQDRITYLLRYFPECGD